MEKIKFNDKTKFTIIREIVINKIDKGNGYTYIQKSHIEETPNSIKDFELGSVRKPKNKDVVGLKWNIPSKRRESNPFDNIFKNL